MRAGTLRHLVTIQRPVNTKSTAGAAVVVWQDVATVRASIEMLKPYEKAAAAAKFPMADYAIRMRYTPGIAAAMRVMHGSEVYTILGQPDDVDGRHRELVLTCERGA